MDEPLIMNPRASPTRWIAIFFSVHDWFVFCEVEDEDKLK